MFFAVVFIETTVLADEYYSAFLYDNGNVTDLGSFGGIY
ncbi:MAG: hypothetical protein HY806_10025, partial [Nitrospirae bacterium]|nr:hypothetical protein [Nitrospirota bacterium]